MSWNKFRESVLKTMKSPPKNTEELANKIGNSYDLAVKKPPAGDILNRNYVMKGNLQEFIDHIKSVYDKQSKSPIQLPIVNLISAGFPKYWRNAELSILFPPKPTPAFAPTTVISNKVTFAGLPATKIFSTKNQTPEKIVEDLITAAKDHLKTLSGKVEFNCIYPTVPTPTPGVATLPWFGYFVKDSDEENENNNNTFAEWDSIFNTGKSKLFSALEKNNIDTTIVNQYAKPLISSLYNLKPFILDDAKSSDAISTKTKKYITISILPAVIVSIDAYWKSLGYVKKQTFKLLTKGNDKKIKSSVDSLVTSFVYGMAAYTVDNIQNENLTFVINDLQNYMGGSESLFGKTVAIKINSLD